MENLAVVGAKRWIVELLTTKKVSSQLMSELGGEMSLKGSSEETKLVLMGMVATNDLAKSAVGAMTAQLEVFERVGLASAAAVSDTQRNGYLERPTTKKVTENNKASVCQAL